MRQIPEARLAIAGLSLALLIGWPVARPAAGDVPDSPKQIQPLPVGARIPQVTLTTSDGKALDLSAATAGKPTILIFYRGGW